MRFAKYEGLGNDFLVVDAGAPEVAVLDAPRVAALCDRHFGVGADGVLFVGAREGRPEMRVINADGSTAEMCGNGIRCVALHLVRTGFARRNDELTIDTDAGPHRCRVIDDTTVSVEMRPPKVGDWRDAQVEVAGENVRLTAVSMGNPHVVLFDVAGDVPPRIGPTLERDARFPGGVNVGFARMDAGAIELVVWERGVGFTRACGTGACAAAVAAVVTGRAPRGTPLQVRLPGGTLQIEVGPEGDPVRMTGPAHFVYEGRVDPDALLRSRQRGPGA